MLDNDSDGSDTDSPAPPDDTRQLARMLGGTSPIPLDENETQLDVDESFAQSEAISQATSTAFPGNTSKSVAAPRVGRTLTESSAADYDKTIKVKMLDAENFTTAWEDLVQLAPPPDHGLRSPIVHDLLREWTSDNAMHESLLGWMDRAIAGADPLDMPPLTVSSLNHQVRDGLAMHGQVYNLIIPQALRTAQTGHQLVVRAAGEQQTPQTQPF